MKNYFLDKLSPVNMALYMSYFRQHAELKRQQREAGQKFRRNV
jgi:hypothetical protein